jgi:hypothetical protein
MTHMYWKPVNVIPTAVRCNCFGGRDQSRNGRSKRHQRFKFPNRCHWGQPHTLLIKHVLAEVGCGCRCKVKESCPTTRHGGRGEEVSPLLILDLGTRWEWVVSVTPRPRFIPEERTPGTHWIGGWVDLRAGFDAEAKRKILLDCRGPIPGRPVRNQTLYWLSYTGSLTIVIIITFNSLTLTHTENFDSISLEFVSFQTLIISPLTD